MKKKIVPLLIVGILVLSGLGAVSITDDTIYGAEIKEKSKMIMMAFSSPIMEESNSDYFEVHLEEASSYLMIPGQPMVPKVVKTVELEFGVRNVRVDVTPKNVQEYEIIKEIRPAPVPVPLTTGNNVVVEPMKDEEVYASEEPFPSTWYSYHVSCGLNANNERVTHVAISVFPVRYIPTEGKLYVAESADISITYEEPEMNTVNTDMNILLRNDEYDLVIIAPSAFVNDLQKLVDHKNNFCGVETILVTTNEIYDGDYFPVQGRDDPEKIKYFIKDVIETWDIKYVLLVGGLKSLIWAKPRDDDNQGTTGWHVPVRYNNLFDDPKYPLAGGIYDPGVISDLYYADIYKEGGQFEDWDPNGDGVFAAWGRPNVKNDTNPGIDMSPDVAVGRLACRNTREVKIMVDKIINYENNAYGSDWFNKITVVAGDGFLDQEDLDIQWDINDVNEYPDGDYTIYAQSKNPAGTKGPIDETSIIIDRTKETSLTFNHDDHLIPEVQDGYPAPPIAKITSLSDGDILGNNDFFYKPEENEAYCNEFFDWATVSYQDGIMHIRGKSYDPQPYGVETDIHVWINNANGETVFSDWRNGMEMYFESEWVTGERLLKGQGGALYYFDKYLPGQFTKNFLWTSNGKWTGQSDVINAFSEGSGFVFFTGHGAPYTWGNHRAGIPGNRMGAHVGGLDIINFDYTPPFFPMEQLSNEYKPPVVVVGGCHNSQFNVSLLATILKVPYMWCYGAPVPECWSWWLTRLSKRGAIATIGNTGFGYGVPGEDCTSIGLDGGICIEFFKQYAEGHQILGDAYRQTLTNYVTTFDMTLQEHGKTLQQWLLLGDPSLKIGGYQAQQKVKISSITNGGVGCEPGEIEFEATAQGTPDSIGWDLTGNGDYDDADGEEADRMFEEPGVYWVGVKATYGSEEYIYDTIVEILQNPNKPSKPSGPTDIEAGTEYTYTFSANDPYAEKIWYLVDWGDGEYTFVEPEKLSGSHTWTEKGTYKIKVKALGVYGEESGWSNPLTISLSKSKQLINLEPGIYVETVKKISFPITIIVGSIDIKVDAADDDGINRVEFYIDEELKAIDDDTTDNTYVWTWDEFSFGRHTLTVKAYDNAGNSDTDEMTVWKFF